MAGVEGTSLLEDRAESGNEEEGGKEGGREGGREDLLPVVPHVLLGAVQLHVEVLLVV